MTDNTNTDPDAHGADEYDPAHWDKRIVDHTSAALDEAHGRMDGHEDAIGELQTRHDSLDAALSDLADRLAAIETQAGAAREDVAATREATSKATGEMKAVSGSTFAKKWFGIPG